MMVDGRMVCANCSSPPDGQKQDGPSGGLFLDPKAIKTGFNAGIGCLLLGLAILLFLLFLRYIFQNNL